MFFAVLINLSLCATNNKYSEIGIDIDKISFFLPLENSDQAEKYVRRYFLAHPEDIQQLISRSYRYFPVIENLLRENGLPEDLKYLPVVESELKENALSQSQAVGLWQMVSNTASHYGLEINSDIDERLFATKSTAAAIKYLSALYNQFDDWGLTLLAYNYGPTNLREKIKEHNTRNYQLLLNHLPSETQEYVYKIMAAKYFFEHVNTIAPSYEVPHAKDYTISIVAFPEDKSFNDILSMFPEYKHQLLENNKHILNTTGKGLNTLFALPFGLDLETRSFSDVVSVKHRLLPGQSRDDILNFLNVQSGYFNYWNNIIKDENTADRLDTYYIPEHLLDAFNLQFGLENPDLLPHKKYVAKSIDHHVSMSKTLAEKKDNKTLKYVVQSFDTLSHIAFLHNCNIADIYKANPNMENLRNGQVLEIPISEPSIDL